MPKLGLTMTEGLVASWNVKAGDAVRSGDILLVVETDKIATEVSAEGDGRLETIVVAEGETVSVGSVIATWSPAAAGTGPVASARSAVAEKVSITRLPADESTNGAARILATPLARRNARLSGLDLGKIRGSGPRGRIKAVDVISALDASPAVAEASDRHDAPLIPGTTRPPTPMEKTIARRLTAAKQAIPHFYVMANADVTDLLALRKMLNADTGFAKVTVNHLLMAALIRALRQMPEMNLVWTDDGIVTFATIDIGLAVDTGEGLFAPVLPDVGSCSLSDLVAKADRLIQRARDGRLVSRDLSGGAVTISNVGMHQASFLVPIINPGQSAILGVGGIKPVFRPDDMGAPALRQEIGLALSCDHRVHDGVKAASFLNMVVSLLEQPLRLLRV